MRLTETNLALGVPEEAKKAAAVLGNNYPGTIWYQRAYKLIEDHPPVTKPPVLPVMTPPASAPTPAPTPTTPGV
jgi:outer membrane protein assembly factor BamD